MFNPARIISKYVQSENNENMPEEVIRKFRELGSAQRGAPENAMLKAQHALGGGLLGFLLEHIGDLTHRMTHQIPQRSGREEVSEKTRKTLKILNSPYGVGREINENAEANAEYWGISVKDYWDRVKPLLERYVSEHKKLPVYNLPQYLAREAAVAIGNMDYSKASKLLNLLDEMVRSDKWEDLAREYRLDSGGNLLQYPYNKRAIESRKVFSKVMTLYHGTDSKPFEAFEPRESKRTILFTDFPVKTEGFFFKKTPEEASEYGKNVLEAEVRLANPISDKDPDKLYALYAPMMKLNDRGVLWYKGESIGFADEDQDELKERLLHKLTRFNTNPFLVDWMDLDEKDFTDRMKKLGFDGAYVEEPHDDDYSIFVLNPEQIKIKRWLK